MERTEKKFTPLQFGKTTGKAVLRLLYPPRCILCDTILVKGEEGCLCEKTSEGGRADLLSMWEACRKLGDGVLR